MLARITAGFAGAGGFELIRVFDADEDVALRGQGAAGGHLAFGEGHAEVVVDAHDFAGALHLGAEDDVHAGELAEGEDGFFDAVMLGDDFFGETEFLQGLAGHDLGGELWQRDADGFADEGRGAGGAGVDFDDVEVVAFDGELHVHQAAHVEGLGELFGGVADAVLHRWREAEGRDDAGAVAGVDAGFFDVLHDGADDGRFAVADAIDIDLGGVFEEAVHEHGAVGRGLDGVLHVVGEFGVAIDDLHGAAAEHEAGAHEAGVADLRGDGQGLLQRGGGAAGGLVEAKVVEQGGEEFAVFGEFDVLGRSADDADAVFFEAFGEVQRGLAAELDDDAEHLVVAVFALVDVEHVFEREGLKVELVAGVVVGGDGLGVGVDHDGLEAEFAQSEAGMDAAVVELDALADAVRAATEDDDFFAVVVGDFALGAVGAVVVGREGLELGGAGVHEAVGGGDASCLPGGAGGGFGIGRMGLIGRIGQLAIREAELFGFAQVQGGEVLLGLHDFFNLPQEPSINLGEREDLLHIPAFGKSLAEEKDALGVGDGELGGQCLVIDDDIGSIADQTEALDLQAAQGLLQALFEGAADGHGFAHGLHLRGERFVGTRELLEGEARDLGDDVVDGGLERGGGVARDVIFELVERVADGELRGDLRNREASGFGRERGAAADARVHLDDDHAAGVRMHGELDVRPAGLHADLADAREAEVAHDLILAIGERLDGSDGDRVAGVHAHGVEVLDGADDDAVVRLVADDFHLELLPAEQRFLDEHLGDGRQIKAAGGDGLELFSVVSDAAAGAAERVGGADDEGQRADLFGDLACLLHVMSDAGLRQVEANFEHGFFEKQTVLAFLNGFRFRADHAHAVLFQSARAVQRHGGVQRRLAAERGQQHIGLFLDDDLLHHLRRDRLDVSPERELRIGHDGGRVGVDEHHLVAFLAQGFAGLDA